MNKHILCPDLRASVASVLELRGRDEKRGIENKYTQSRRTLKDYFPKSEKSK